MRYYLRICLDGLRQLQRVSVTSGQSFHPETSGIKTVPNSILYETNFGREILFSYNTWIILHYNTSIWGWGGPVGIVIRLRARGLKNAFRRPVQKRDFPRLWRVQKKIWVHPSFYSMGQRALSLGERSCGMSRDLYVCLSFSTQKRITANMSAQGK